MRKINLKTKRKRKWKRRFLILAFLISFLYTCFSLSLHMTNEEFVRFLFESKENPNFYIIKMFDSVFKNRISLQNPLKIFKGNYSYEDYSKNDADSEEEPTSGNYVSDPYPKKEIKEPKVYLYNSHQLEEYSSKNVEKYNVTPNVMMLSYILREKLNDRGIQTIVEENNVSEFLKANNWNYASSYKVTKLLLEDAKSKNPSLEYYIDLHRDSVGRNVTVADIKGKKYARILFLLGLENPNYQQNAAFIEKLNSMFNESYPGLSRGIYKKQGKGVNGVYNQDFSPTTILIEVGGVENTIEEVFNTAEAIADILNRYMESAS